MVHRQQKVKPSATILKNELRGIKSVDLLLKAANIIEKLFWGVVFIIGMVWATYFLNNELESWQETPSIMRYQQLKLSEIQSPAITFCSPSSTKFAIAERLGNYLNAEHNIPDQFIKIREVLLKNFLDGTSLPGIQVFSVGELPRCPKLDCKVLI